MKIIDHVKDLFSKERRKKKTINLSYQKLTKNAADPSNLEPVSDVYIVLRREDFGENQEALDKFLTLSPNDEPLTFRKDPHFNRVCVYNAQGDAVLNHAEQHTILGITKKSGPLGLFLAERFKAISPPQKISIDKEKFGHWGFAHLNRQTSREYRRELTQDAHDTLTHLSEYPNVTEGRLKRLVFSALKKCEDTLERCLKYTSKDSDIHQNLETQREEISQKNSSYPLKIEIEFSPTLLSSLPATMLTELPPENEAVTRGILAPTEVSDRASPRDVLGVSRLSWKRHYGTFGIEGTLTNVDGEHFRHCQDLIPKEELSAETGVSFEDLQSFVSKMVKIKLNSEGRHRYSIQESKQKNRADVGKSL